MDNEDGDLPVMSPEQARDAGAVNHGMDNGDNGDDLPVMSPEEARAAGAVNLGSSDASLPDSQPGRIPAEGHLAADAREIAHAALPAAGGYVAAGYGAAAGAGLGAMAAPVTGGLSIPVGTALGAIIGFAGGGMAISAIQERAAKAFGLDDSAQRQANEEARPIETTIAQTAPGLAGMSLGMGVKVWQRLISAGALTTFEGAQQYMTNGKFDPVKLAIAGAEGAAFPTPNKLGSKLLGIGEKGAITGKQVTPRPDVAEATPGFDATTGESTNEVSPDNSPLAESVGPGTGSQDAGVGGSAKNYSKDQAQPGQNAGVTTGDVRPDVAAAIQASSEPPAEQLPLQTGLEQAAAGAPQPTPRVTPRRVLDEAAEASKQPGIQAPQDQQQEAPQLRVSPANAGKPKLGLKPSEPIGSPDATPVADENAKPSLADKVAAVRGDIHPEPSDAQVEAENFNKGYPGRFAGRDIALETAKGGIRRSKPGQPPWEVEMPYDYGHLLRTKGADGDPLDFGFVGTGDKHFVVDQKNADTGKFDEHKIMGFAKDEADALDHYQRGFSDDKGEQRVQGITEASEDQIRDFANKLANMPAKRKLPFGEPRAVTATVNPKTETVRGLPEGNKPEKTPELIPLDNHPGGVLAKDRVAVRDMLKNMRAQGKGAQADAIEALPNAQLLKYVEDNNIRRRNYGVAGTGGYEVHPELKNPDGTPVTANKPELAKLRGKAIGSVKQAFSEHPPAAGEDNGALLDRLRKGVNRANELNGGGDAAKAYRPQDASNRVEWTWVDQAKRTLAKPTPGAIAKFKEAEQFLRGSKESALDYLQGRRVNADVEKSRRSGDEAVGRAEAAAAERDAGRNATEDELIDAIDAKRGPLRADIPHEEAEAMVKPSPVKTKADLREPKGKQIDMTTDKGHDELDKLLSAGKERRQADKPTAPEAVKAPVRNIEITPEERAKYAASLDKAMKRGQIRDEEARAEPVEPEEKPSELEKQANSILGDYLKDENASLDLNKIIKDLKTSVRSFSKIHEADSYISKTSTGVGDDYARSIDEKFHANRQEAKNDVIDGLQHVSDGVKGGITPELDKKFYLLREANKLNQLTPEEKALYDKYVKPFAEAKDAIFKAGRQLDPKKFGPEVEQHVSRILLNDTPGYDSVLRGGASDDPIEGRINALSTAQKGPAMERKFFALEGSDGRRFVITPNKTGYTLWDKYKGIRVHDPNFEFVDGGSLKVKNNTYKMTQALTPEIEANARLQGGAIPRYSKSVLLADAYAHAVTKAMVRDIKMVMDLKHSDEFNRFATTNHEVAEQRGSNSGEAWKKTTLPNFDEYYMHPDLRAVMDNFAQPGFEGFETARALSQGVTKLLFWLPIAHINNVGAHWFVERGWDWVNPMGYRRLLPTAMRAIKSVMTQDHIQNVLRREGAGTIYGGVISRNWLNKAAQMVGQDMKDRPAKWDPIAKSLGWGPSTMLKAWYDGSQRVMWAVNDMFMTQAYLENMLKGRSMTGAIRSTERHIPNYRLPGKIIGSGEKGRFMGKILAEPTLVSFGRYHYEVFNSFAHIAKDMVHGDAKQKFDALGNIMAMGILGLGIYPLMDEAYKKITGNEHASAHRRGPMAVGSLVHDAVKGSKDPMAAPRSALTVSPMAQAILELRSNKDFAGRNIIEPGDVKQAFQGKPGAAARVAGSGAEYLARSLISPYGTFANAYQTKKQGPLATFRDQALDIKNPSPKANKYEALSGKKAIQQSQSRFRQGGRGPLEHLIDKVVGY